MAFHLYRIREIFSDVTGSIQFIELSVGSSNFESFWESETIRVEQNNQINSFVFPTDLPSTETANTSVILATQGFADLGVVLPDFIVPNNFLFTQGEATIDFGGVDRVMYSDLPLNGVQSINQDGVPSINSPKNFAGVSGTIAGDNIVLGTSQTDNLNGTSSSDVILGLAGNDRMNGDLGDDVLEGNGGVDAAIYNDNSRSYVITNDAVSNLISVSGPEGNDTLFNIERIEFSDTALAFDLALNQSAGNTVRIIGAAFDSGSISPDTVKLGLQLFDSGKSILEISELIVNLPLFQSLAGSTSSDDFVSLVYENIVGSEPAISEVTSLTGLLVENGGTLSKADLLTLAANSELNEINIDLVGLMQSGVEYSIV